MRPKPKDYKVKIPLTFDVFSGGSMDYTGRSLWLIVVGIVWLTLSILCIVYAFGMAKFWYTLGITLIAVWISRFVIMREKYFKKRIKELEDNNFFFDHSLFWDIYDVSEFYPHFVNFRNGTKGLFVQFDKDVIVGKGENDNYYHHEAIANAYQQMVTRNIRCVHIDYMDIVGRDDRMDSLFDTAKEIENPELKRVMTRIYSNIQYIMNKSYASYDVYCFIYKGPDDIFWDEMQAILRCFNNANYIRYRILKKEDIGLLAKVMLNLDSFSANRACEEVFKETNKVQYLRTIWVERDGERKIVNRTKEEIAEAKRIAEAEKITRKSAKKLKFKRNKDKDEDLDLF